MNSLLNSLVWSTNNLRFRLPIFLSEFAKMKILLFKNQLITEYYSLQTRVETSLRRLCLRVMGTGSKAKATPSSVSRVVSFTLGTSVTSESLLSTSGKQERRTLKKWKLRGWKLYSGHCAKTHLHPFDADHHLLQNCLCVRVGALPGWSMGSLSDHWGLSGSLKGD